MTDTRAGDPDRIERHVSRGLLQANEVFGRDRFREWAQRESNANTAGYAALRSGAEPIRAAWRDQPWVTPVVGSGPIGFPEDFAKNAAWLPRLVLQEMEAGYGQWLGGDLDAAVVRGADPAEFVPAFVNALITRRYGIHVDPPRDGDQQPDLTIDRSVVWVVVAAAQLTRTFHRMSLDSTRPISRWGSEKAQVARNEPRFAELADEYLPLLQEACRQAGAALKERALRLEAGDAPSQNGPQAAVALRAIAGLVEEILEKVGFEDPQILLVHLEQLTDASWYLLAQTVLNDIDPGWTSLMLQLILTQPDVRAAGLFRPRWNELEAMASRVGDVYTRASANAAARRRTPEREGESLVTKFYDSVADVLWAQSESVQWAATRQRADSEGEISWMLPRPVSWVCSFDYEVELALWRAAEERGHSAQFAVVLPVYVRQADRPSYGTLVWLEATIAVPRGAKELDDADAFRQATTVSSWRLLSNTVGEAGAGDETHHRPVVVHLLGCPLLDLPDIAPPTPGPGATPGQNLLRSALMEAGALTESTRAHASPTGRRGPRRSALVHAVTVNEVLAVRQSARDWSQSSDTADSTSLPLDLFRAADSASRMYTVLGVPLRDPAVRLRVTTVLSRGAQDRDKPDDACLGLFVNKKIDDEELTMLGDLGLDVVKTRVEDFGPSLSGYADWLREHREQIEGWSEGPGTTTGAERSAARPQSHDEADDEPSRASNEAEPKQLKRSWKGLAQS